MARQARPPSWRSSPAGRWCWSSMRAGRGPRSRPCCAVSPIIGPNCRSPVSSSTGSASHRHGALLAGAAARHLPGLAVLGALPADPALALPSRHLGLVPAGETAAAEAVIDRAAAQIGVSFDIDRLLRLARPSLLGGAADGNAPIFRRSAKASLSPATTRSALSIRPCSTAGAATAPSSAFSRRWPMSRPTPARLRSICRAAIPSCGPAGSLPAERFFDGLRARRRRSQAGLWRMRRLHGAGRGADRCRRPPRTRWPGCCRWRRALPNAACRSAIAVRRLLASGPLGPRGARFRGHEFHYATVIREGAADRLWSVANAAGADLGRHGLRRGSAFGSFIHLIDCG